MSGLRVRDVKPRQPQTVYLQGIACDARGRTRLVCMCWTCAGSADERMRRSATRVKESTLRKDRFWLLYAAKGKPVQHVTQQITRQLAQRAGSIIPGRAGR